MVTPGEQEEGKQYIHHPVISGRIEFDNVSFKYPEWKPAPCTTSICVSNRARR